MKLGIWPAEYALGERYRAMRYLVDGYEESSIPRRLQEYVDNQWTGDMQSYQKSGERAAIAWEWSKTGRTGGGNNALFGTPIDRSKENTDRMHAITLSMGADTGRRDGAPGSYNQATVPMFVLRHPTTGRYLADTGGYTSDKQKARPFYSTEEALKTWKTHKVEEL